MRIRSRFVFFLALLLASGVAVGPCRAWAASASTEADAAIKRGLDLRRRGDDLQALAEFQRAYALQRSARALAQIGFAEQALGRWRDAEEHLGLALADADDGWVRLHRATIERSRALVAGHLGSLEVLGEPAGAELLVGGAVVGRLPLARPLRVDVGRIGVEVRADGYLPVSRPVTITAGELSRETVTLQKVVPPPPQSIALVLLPAAREPLAFGSSLPPIIEVARPPEDPGGGWQRPAAWISAAAAVLFAGGAVVALVERGRFADQVAGAIRDGRCTQDGDSFAGSASRGCASAATNRDEAQTLAVVGGGMAGVFVLTSAILFSTGTRF